MFGILKGSDLDNSPMCLIMTDAKRKPEAKEVSVDELWTVKATEFLIRAPIAMSTSFFFYVCVCVFADLRSSWLKCNIFIYTFTTFLS